VRDAERLEAQRGWVLPVGTQVATRVEVRVAPGAPLRPAGAVAVIVKSPSGPRGPYLIRFPDGAEAAVSRADLDIRSHLARQELEQARGRGLAGVDPNNYVIYRCVVGSRAFGLDEPDSDVDRRGIYLPPAEAHWSLFGVPEQLEDQAAQSCYWELQKFLTLALRANPNVLECLYTPLVEHATPLARELLAMRSAFLSRLVYQTFNGYVLSQFKRLEADLRIDGEICWKHAMHLVRLLLSGTSALQHGEIPVRVDEHRDRLLAVRRGEMPWEEVDAWRLRLHAEFDQAFAHTRLPDRPDYERANAFLIRARRSMVS
jgi:predicted nucleotidyltransferase